MNDDINDEQVFTPFTHSVPCLFFPYSYNVSSDVDLATITAAHILDKSEGSGYTI